MVRFRPLLLAACVLLAVPAAADAWVYKGTLTVTGSLSIVSRYDSTKPCAPGQRWTLTNALELDVRTPMTLTGHPGDVTGTVVRGLATGGHQTATLADYTETNWCDSAPAALVKPDCRELRFGGLFTQINTDPRGRKVVLDVARRNGPTQPLTCEEPPVYPTPSFAALSTLPGVAATGLDLPLGVGPRAYRKLRRGATLTRRVYAGGACDAAWVSAGKQAPGAGTCTLSGAFTITLKRNR